MEDIDNYPVFSPNLHPDAFSFPFGMMNRFYDLVGEDVKKPYKNKKMKKEPQGSLTKYFINVIKSHSPRRTRTTENQNSGKCPDIKKTPPHMP